MGIGRIYKESGIMVPMDQKDLDRVREIVGGCASNFAALQRSMPMLAALGLSAGKSLGSTLSELSRPTIRTATANLEAYMKSVREPTGLTAQILAAKSRYSMCLQPLLGCPLHSYRMSKTS